MFRRSKIVFQRKFIKKISQAKDRRCLMALHESAEDYLEALYLLQKSYQSYVQSILQIFSDTVNQVLRIW